MKMLETFCVKKKIKKRLFAFLSKMLSTKMFGFVSLEVISLFNGISTPVGYLMPKPFS